MRVYVAIVHHANQYLITDGYDSREGITAAVGSIENGAGLSWILELHRIHRIPLNIHFSGTLIEAIAWHRPDFFPLVRSMLAEGLLEIVGSCYGQNVMRFFSHDHNLAQLNEELRLCQIHLGLSPDRIKVFWPPERVWDAERMAPVLRDPRLLNHGYDYVLVDDRVLLPSSGRSSPRLCYDQNHYWDPLLFQMYRIQNGQGLIALPISYNLRNSVPPRGEECWRSLRSQFHWLSELDPEVHGGDFIAVYGDAMEKAAGLGNWDIHGPRQYETFLRWIGDSSQIQTVNLGDWASSRRVAGVRETEAGTFHELANTFGAGEDYENWFLDPRWSSYRSFFSWSESRVQELTGLGADPALIEMATKHLLASSWETAWHTPRSGVHGNANGAGDPSPWIRALASHSRHAAVIAEAAYWMRHKDEEAHAYLYDIDNDGEEELILKSDKLFAVVSPRWGGRLVYLFSVDGAEGKMLVGNPSDDWNWMEELNKYMETPRNHPGALADAGFEQDCYRAVILNASGRGVCAELKNQQRESMAYGLAKNLFLFQGDNALRVEYKLPDSLNGIDIEFGLSPDYLSLLRKGMSLVRDQARDEGSRGYAAGDVTVWVRRDRQGDNAWTRPYQNVFGHGRSLRLSSKDRRFSIMIGVDIASPGIEDQNDLSSRSLPRSSPIGPRNVATH